MTQLIQPTWTLQRWGMDIFGLMPGAQGNLKYALVAVEYFSKWIEAKDLAIITSVTIQKFLWQNIICCFGVPRSITVDNGTQFDSEASRTFCNHVGTNIHFASVRHLESNNLIERENGIILLGITKSLVGLPKGKWTEELIKVVWNHNTSTSRSTSFTPFELLFGDEVVSPKKSN
jgi:transposase InsO family protein